MKVQRLSIDGLLLIEPDVFTDDRGYFLELFHREKFSVQNIKEEFHQDNLSISKKNVIRGLHFQKAPFEQGKLVRVLQGAALDVVVDLRKSSATFGHYETAQLDDKNNRSLWIPAGFAHGFAALEDDTIFHYKCTNFYNKASELGILYNDPELNIPWKISNPVVSKKDLELMTFKEYRESIGMHGQV